MGMELLEFRARKGNPLQTRRVLQQTTQLKLINDGQPEGTGTGTNVPDNKLRRRYIQRGSART
jgi:hypothetical protein